jgi:membrane-associated HD superfamily phosphohydrolase
MDELTTAFRKNPIAWSIFTLYLIGWISPILVEIFFAPAKNQSQLKNYHPPFIGFLTISILYLLIMLIIGFVNKKNNIYLKISGYIGISLIIFAAIYNKS